MPLLAGDHVTEDTGTGFVHTAPGHGAEDFDIWMEHRRDLAKASTRRSRSPSTPTASSPRTRRASTGKRVIDDKGENGDANGR